MNERTQSADAYGDSAREPGERGEALLHALARLKLRLEVCLRKERSLLAYRAALVRCLDDVDDIVHAATADARSGHPRVAVDDAGS
ncbi:hypothetical protein [Pendulispora albinea]|uniref:Uncharacterized protein n=1 Tax=Pendulispora albinea TaxID=2741071 RepID=A0ABZ2M551_9BACT